VARVFLCPKNGNDLHWEIPYDKWFFVSHHPKIVQNQASEDCLEVTYSTETSRKSFLICIPPKTDEPPPQAIESFAMDPNHYHQLMERVEKMIKNDS